MSKHSAEKGGERSGSRREKKASSKDERDASQQSSKNDPPARLQQVLGNRAIQRLVEGGYGSGEAAKSDDRSSGGESVKKIRKSMSDQVVQRLAESAGGGTGGGTGGGAGGSVGGGGGGSLSGANTGGAAGEAGGHASAGEARQASRRDNSGTGGNTGTPAKSGGRAAGRQAATDRAESSAGTTSRAESRRGPATSQDGHQEPMADAAEQTEETELEHQPTETRERQESESEDSGGSGSDGGDSGGNSGDADGGDGDSGGSDGDAGSIGESGSGGELGSGPGDVGSGEGDGTSSDGGPGNGNENANENANASGDGDGDPASSGVSSSSSSSSGEGAAGDGGESGSGDAGPDAGDGTSGPDLGSGGLGDADGGPSDTDGGDVVGASDVESGAADSRTQERRPQESEGRFSVTSADNRFEREANRVARQAVADEDAPGLSARSVSSQGNSEMDLEGPAPASVDEVVESAGSPLSSGVRQEMESLLGVDLGRVRMHTDAKAARSAREVDARAYTVGNHVVFASGEHAPETRSGRYVLAHELAHVAQQDGEAARVQRATLKERIVGTEEEKQAKEVESRIKNAEKETRLIRDALRNWVKGAESVHRFSSEEVTNIFTQLDEAEKHTKLEEGSTPSSGDQPISEEKVDDAEKAVGEARSLLLNWAEKEGESIKDSTEGSVAGDIEANMNSLEHTLIHQEGASADDLIDEVEKDVNGVNIALSKAERNLSELNLMYNGLHDLKEQLPKGTTARINVKATRDSIEHHKQSAESTLNKHNYERLRANPAFGGTVDTETLKKLKIGQINNLEKEVGTRLGADGAPRLRVWKQSFRNGPSTKVNQFQKDIAREKGKEVSEAIAEDRTDVGEATREYAKLAAQDEVYGASKRALKSFLASEARGIVDKEFTDQAFFKTVFRAMYLEGKSQTDAVKHATKASKRNIKTKISQRERNSQGEENRRFSQGITDRVGADETVKGAVDNVIYASTAEEGMGKVGEAIDLAVPYMGDQADLSLEVKIPISGTTGFVSFGVSGTAARGIDGAVTAGVPTLAKNKNHLEASFTVSIGGGAAIPGVSMSGITVIPGVSVSGTINFLTRSAGKNTNKAMMAMNYAIYRGLTDHKATWPIADWWAGAGPMQRTQAEKRHRAEAWAAMVEEQVFAADGDGKNFADTGTGGGITVESSVAGVTGSASLSFMAAQRSSKEMLEEGYVGLNKSSPPESGKGYAKAIMDGKQAEQKRGDVNKLRGTQKRAKSVSVSGAFKKDNGISFSIGMSGPIKDFDDNHGVKIAVTIPAGTFVSEKTHTIVHGVAMVLNTITSKVSTELEKEERESSDSDKQSSKSGAGAVGKKANMSSSLESEIMSAMAQAGYVKGTKDEVTVEKKTEVDILFGGTDEDPIKRVDVFLLAGMGLDVSAGPTAIKASYTKKTLLATGGQNAEHGLTFGAGGARVSQNK